MLRIIPSLFTLIAALVMLIGKTPCQKVGLPEKPVHIAKIWYQYYENIPYAGEDPAFKNYGYSGQRVIYALNDANAIKMTEIIDRNIRKSWICSEGTPDMVFSGTQDDFTRRYLPQKFKPKVPKERSDEKYLYMRLFDAAAPEWATGLSPIKQWYDEATLLILHYKIVTGRESQALFERVMRISVERMPVPEEQYPLFRMPGLPDSFMTAFERAVDVFFDTEEPPDTMVLKLPAACILLNMEKEKTVKIPLRFFFGQDRVDISGANDISWIAGNISRTKSKDKIKFGEKFRMGFLDLPELSKYENVDRIPVQFSGDTCITLITIPFTEEKINSGISDRNVMSECFFTQGNDTLGSFHFGVSAGTFKNDTARYFWDGCDSSTIRFLPRSWGNQGLYRVTSLEGILYDKPFTISNIHAGNMFDIFYDSKLIATIKTNYGQPEKGYQYNPDLPGRTFQALMLLASIPYAYYGE